MLALDISKLNKGGVGNPVSSTCSSACYGFKYRNEGKKIG